MYLMANFKVAKRDALSDTRTNIYDLHEKRLEYFENEKNRLSEYRQELARLKEEIKVVIEMDDKWEISNRIETLMTRIDSIEDDRELNSYLLDFMSIVNNHSEKDTLFLDSTQKGVMDTFVNASINTSRSELYNEYIKQFNPELRNINVNRSNEKKTCQKCGSEKFHTDTKTSSEICSDCGLVNYILYSEDTISYNENLEQVSVFNYKRNNHFQECLNQLQAKENTTIPPIIIQRLASEFKKYNITDPKLFTPSLVKVYLRKLEYNKYYEHIPTIINEFCGLPAPRLTPQLEQQLKIMFDEIQAPFEKYRLKICPMRKNFLNYNYIFYKMCQLLNKDEFLNCFPLLKSREKLYEHDQIWKGICKDLRWQFIASI
jgi:hypothetical protein